MSNHSRKIYRSMARQDIRRLALELVFLVKEEGKNVVIGGGFKIITRRKALYSKFGYFQLELPVCTNRYNGSHKKGT